MYAARALADLAYFPLPRRALGEPEVISTLVALLQNGTALAKEQAAMVLGNVVCSNGNMVFVTAARAISLRSSLPPREKRHRQRERQRREGPSESRCRNNDNQVLIVAAGAIPPLVVAFSRTVPTWRSWRSRVNASTSRRQLQGRHRKGRGHSAARRPHPERRRP